MQYPLRENQEVAAFRGFEHLQEIEDTQNSIPTPMRAHYKYGDTSEFPSYLNESEVIISTQDKSEPSKLKRTFKQRSPTYKEFNNRSNVPGFDFD